VRVQNHRGEERTTYPVALFYVLLIKYHLGDLIKENGMGGACDLYGGEERCIQDFGGET